VIRTYYRLSMFILAAALLVVSGCGLSVYGQGQPGGGTLPGDASGGAALIFRKPDNPPVHTASGASSGTAGGGRISRGSRVRAAAVAAAAHERVIARGNAARSAPRPRYSEAEDQYKLAATQEPNDARAYAGLGNIYLDQGRFNEATMAYRQALKVKVDYIPAYQPLAYSLVRLNRYPEAIETFKQALQYDANNAEIFNNLGFAYVHAGQNAEAIAASRRAIALLGQTGDAYKQELQISS
jgi:Flp pilus assembly protein TadD